MASKKGVALTVGIAAAIIGSSFLIWYIPIGSSPDVPRTDGEVMNDVYGRHNNLAADINLRFEQWKDRELESSDMSSRLSSAKSQIGEMRQQLDGRQPAQEWQESYNIYVQSLDGYTAYLDALELKVDAGDRTNPDPALNQNWQDLVDQSVAAMPINS
ncbi:MAG TPA: hypothetical protein VD736_00610 [Nitrososphaera sp.]|nr:hypothetical protein [Nitrososphaera sp.]